MARYKLHVIANSNSPYSVYGITIPRDIAMFFNDIYFDIYKSGCSIILSSGCNFNPTRKEVEKYEYEDAR